MQPLVGRRGPRSLSGGPIPVSQPVPAPGGSGMQVPFPGALAFLALDWDEKENLNLLLCSLASVMSVSNSGGVPFSPLFFRFPLWGHHLPGPQVGGKSLGI